MAVYYTEHEGGIIKLFRGRINRRMMVNIFRNKDLQLSQNHSIFRKKPASVFFTRKGQVTHVYDVDKGMYRNNMPYYPLNKCVNYNL